MPRWPERIGMIRLRFYDPDGAEIDTVIIYQDGNCSGIPARTAWVEVTAMEGN